MIEEQLLYFLQYCDYLCNDKIILINSYVYSFLKFTDVSKYFP